MAWTGYAVIHLLLLISGRVLPQLTSATSAKPSIVVHSVRASLKKTT